VSARGGRRLGPRSWWRGLGNYRCSSPPLPSWFPREGGGTRRRSSNDFFRLSFVISLVFYIFSGKAWAEGKGELAQDVGKDYRNTGFLPLTDAWKTEAQKSLRFNRK